MIPTSLQKKAVDQLHVNHMAIEMRIHVVHESIYGVSINIDIENTIKNSNVYFDFQGTQSKNRTLSHDIQGRPWIYIKGHIFSINNKHYHCIVHYHSK